MEWSQATINTKDGERQIITTSHSEDDDIGGSYVVYVLDPNENNLSELNHSHSYENDLLSEGDVNVAKKVHEKFPNAIMHIYDRISYKVFDEYSVYGILDELIVNPSP